MPEEDGEQAQELTLVIPDASAPRLSLLLDRALAS
jgi:hypothetical protein